MVALFVASHYRNTPNDLLLMADAPAHHLFVLLGPLDEAVNALPDVLAVVQVPDLCVGMGTCQHVNAIWIKASPTMARLSFRVLGFQETVNALPDVLAIVRVPDMYVGVIRVLVGFSVQSYQEGLSTMDTYSSWTERSLMRCKLCGCLAAPGHVLVAKILW